MKDEPKYEMGMPNPKWWAAAFKRRDEYLLRLSTDERHGICDTTAKLRAEVVRLTGCCDMLTAKSEMYYDEVVALEQKLKASQCQVRVLTELESWLDYQLSHKSPVYRPGVEGVLKKIADLKRNTSKGRSE